MAKMFAKKFNRSWIFQVFKQKSLKLSAVSEFSGFFSIPMHVRQLAAVSSKNLPLVGFCWLMDVIQPQFLASIFFENRGKSKLTASFVFFGLLDCRSITQKRWWLQFKKLQQYRKLLIRTLTDANPGACYGKNWLLISRRIKINSRSWQFQSIRLLVHEKKKCWIKKHASTNGGLLKWSRTL